MYSVFGRFSAVDIFLCIHKVEESVLILVAPIDLFKFGIRLQHIPFGSEKYQALILGQLES